MRRGLRSLLLALSASGAEAAEVVVDPPSLAPGALAVVRVDAAEVRGSFRGKRLAFFRSGEGSIALLGVDLAADPGRYPLRVTVGGGPPIRRDVEVRAIFFPEERLTVPPAYTELDRKTLARVARERRLLDALWRRPGAERLWDGAFQAPSAGPPGSPFGLRRFFNGQPRSPHAGLDYRAPAGSPVVASNRGRVALARFLFFTGNTVVLDHGLGLFTLYVHLSRTSVRPDEIVDKGAEIGSVGATGRATGPHLHFAVRVGDARVDPQALLAARF